MQSVWYMDTPPRSTWCIWWTSYIKSHNREWGGGEQTVKGILPCVKGTTPGWHLLISCWTAFLPHWKNYPCDLQIECLVHVFINGFTFPFIKSVETFTCPLNVCSSVVLCGIMPVTSILFVSECLLWTSPYVRGLYNIFSIHISSTRWPLQFSLYRWGNWVLERLVNCFGSQLVSGRVGFRASRAHALSVGPCHSSVSLPCAILELFLHSLSLDLGSSNFLSQSLGEFDELIQVSSSVEGTEKSPSVDLKFHLSWIPPSSASGLISGWPALWWPVGVCASGSRLGSASNSQGDLRMSLNHFMSLVLQI